MRQIQSCIDSEDILIYKAIKPCCYRKGAQGFFLFA